MTYKKKKQELKYIKESYYDRKESLNFTDTDFLIKELEKAWAALEFYADERVYSDYVPLSHCELMTKRAREALGE